MRSEPCSVLLIADGLACGGAERQIVELLKGLKHRSRVLVALAVLSRGGDLEGEASSFAETLLPVTRNGRYDLSVVVPLVRQARGASVQLVHAVGWMSGLAGLLASRYLGITVVNGSMLNALPRLSLRERISRWCALRSDAIVANSRAGLDAYGLSRHRGASVILNGVDLQRFDGIVPERWDRPVICMVANFSRFKDHETMIRSMPEIAKVFPRVRLVLVGKDAGTLGHTRQLVQRLGLADSIRFVTDTNHPESIIAGSDVCVLASSFGEGISNAILEYMALGKPVIATDCGGNPEVVRHGETGFLVPSRSPGVIAERAVQLLRATDQARQMGAAGRRVIAEGFSMERMVEEYEALYERLLSGRASRTYRAPPSLSG